MNIPSHSVTRFAGIFSSSRILSAGAQMVALFMRYPPDQNPPPSCNACSMSNVLKPAAARSRAHRSPDGPAPTTMTSLSMSRSNPWKCSRAICRVMSRSRRGAVHLFLCAMWIPSCRGTARRAPTSESPLLINLQPRLLELFRLLLHADLEGGPLVHRLLLGVLADILGDLHRAEMRAAHGAEVRRLRRFLGERLIVEGLGRLRVEREIELVLPAELEPGLRQHVVPRLRAGMALGQVRRVRGDLVRDDAGLHVVLVVQAQVILGRDIAEHRAAEPADHGRA